MTDNYETYEQLTSTASYVQDTTLLPVAVLLALIWLALMIAAWMCIEEWD